MDFLCQLRSANVTHMQEDAHTQALALLVSFLAPLTHLPLKHTRSVTSAFQTEKVKRFSSEDVLRAGGARSLTFLSLPMALIWSHGDLAFSPASSWENVKNFEKKKKASQSSQIFSKYNNTMRFQGIKTFFHKTSNLTGSNYST